MSRQILLKNNENQFMSYHTFELGESYYLIDIYKMYFCQIDKDIYDILKSNKYLDIIHNKLLDFFVNKGVFFHNECPTFQLNESEIFVFTFPPQHKCNLKCSYCFAESGKNYIEEDYKFCSKRVMDVCIFLNEDSHTKKYKNYRLNLVSGGEPLIDKMSLLDSIQTAQSIFKKYNKNLYIWLSTNGTLLTTDMVKELEKYNVGFGISIDGTKSVHDQLRPYIDGRGTYDDIHNNIIQIKNDKTLSRKSKELWGLLVYTKLNRNLFENIDHLKSEGFSSVQVRYVRTTDTKLDILNDISTSIKYLREYITRIFDEAIFHGNTDYVILIANENDYIGKYFVRLMLGMNCDRRCGCGKYTFSFCANGDIYPCDAFVGYQQFKIGNIYSSVNYDVIDQFSALSIYQSDSCKVCWCRYICGGDCYHDSLLHTRDFNKPYRNYCKLTRAIIEVLIAKLIEWQKEKRSEYDAFVEIIRLRQRISL